MRLAGIFIAALLAYIPSPASLLKKAAGRNSQLAKTREVALSGNLSVAGQPVKSATLTLHFPLNCKLEAEGAGAVSVKGTASEGTTGPALQLLQIACPLLATRGLSSNEAAGTIRALATGAGIDLTAATAMARIGDRVTYVLGATARDTTRPQLWLYKDTRAPARLIAQSGADLRLLQYGDPAAGDWFPRVIELWTAGQLSARFEALEARGMRPAGEDDDDDSKE
jgi:hypothetical protein